MIDHEEGCDCPECREAGWANKWRVAVDMAARASLQADDMRALAGELVAFIRVNVLHGTFREAAIDQVDEALKPFLERLNAK